MTCELPPPGTSALPNPPAASVVTTAPQSTKAAKEQKVVATTVVQIPVRVAPMPLPSVVPEQNKTVDPAASRETEGVNMAKLCGSARRLRVLPVTKDDPRVQPLLAQLNAIQSALIANDNAKGFQLISEFVPKMDALQSQLSSSGSAEHVSDLKKLPIFATVDNLSYGRLSEILGMDTPNKLGALFPQRTKIVFRLRSLEHQGKNVTAQRNQYNHLNTFLAQLKKSNPENFGRVSAEVKDLASQLNITDMPAYPPPPVAIATANTSSGASASRVQPTSPSAAPNASSAAVPSTAPPSAPSATDVEAINLAKLCASTRQLKNLPIPQDDPRVQPLLQQLTVIQSTLSSGSKDKAYPLIIAFTKSEGRLAAQTRKQSGASGDNESSDEQTAPLQGLPLLSGVEDMVFSRLNQIFGKDTPSRTASALILRVKIIVRLRALESQGQDVSAQRRQYSELNDFLSKQTTVSAAIGKQIQPQVRALASQLGIK